LDFGYEERPGGRFFLNPPGTLWAKAAQRPFVGAAGTIRLLSWKPGVKEIPNKKIRGQRRRHYLI
jgi:hypothetical protein